MKRINILIVIIAAALFTACSKPNLEDRARERAKANLEIRLKDSEVSSYELRNEKVDFSGDSICILQFEVNARSVYGETCVIPMEYIIGWTTVNPSLYEALYPIDRNKKPLPIKVIARNLTKKALPDDKKECERILRIYASSQMVISGRKVKDIAVFEP
jgi:hypothetical protein